MLTPANVLIASCNVAIPDISIRSLPRRDEGLDELAWGFLSPVTVAMSSVSSGTIAGDTTSPAEIPGRTAADKSAYENQAPMRAKANVNGKRIIQLTDLTPGPWV